MDRDKAKKKFRQAIFDRLAQLDKIEGRRVSGSELARRMGTTQQTFSQWQAGTSLPDESHIAKVAREIPEIYDILGIVPPGERASTDPELDYILKHWGELPEIIKRMVMATIEGSARGKQNSSAGNDVAAREPGETKGGILGS